MLFRSLIYLFFLTISLMYSIDLSLSLFGFSIWRDGFIIQLVYILLYFSSQFLKKIDCKIIDFIIYSAIIISIYGILQKLGFDLERGYNVKGFSVFSTMYNQNFYATYLVLILPIIIHKIMVNDNRRYYIFFALIFHNLLLTNTRGAWLGFIISFILYFILYFKYQKSKNAKLKFSMILIIIVSLFVMYDLNSSGLLMKRFLSIFSDAKGLMTEVNINQIGSNRGYIWERTLRYIFKKPIEGYGIQNIMLYFLADYGKEMNAIFGQLLLVNNVHNEYLQIAVSTGIPSLIVYLSFLFNVIIIGIKKIEFDLIYIAFLSSLIAYIIQAFFSLSFISVAFIFWVFLGLLVNNNKLFSGKF